MLVARPQRMAHAHCFRRSGKTTLVKLMAGELLPSLGDIRPHGHLKLGRFTQHFVDVLDMDLTPLEYFEKNYPEDSREDLRKYLGRFGVSGPMQVRKMEEMSDGQKSRVVFAKLGRDNPHILLLDEVRLNPWYAVAVTAPCSCFSRSCIPHCTSCISQRTTWTWNLLTPWRPP